MCDSNSCKKLVRLFIHSVERRPDYSLQSRIHYCRTSSISRFVYRQHSAAQSEIDHWRGFLLQKWLTIVLSTTYLWTAKENKKLYFLKEWVMSGSVQNICICFVSSSQRCFFSCLPHRWPFKPLPTGCWLQRCKVTQCNRALLVCWQSL